MHIFDILPDVDALLALQPEELAGILLEFLNSLNENDAGYFLNVHNFSIDSRVVEGYPPERKKEIVLALMEAWVWLERECMLAPKPSSMGEGWKVITRRGREIRDRTGFESYRRANLLSRSSLHPVIADKVWSSFIRGDYDTAVFQAFKEVEVAVREEGGFLPTDVGVELVRKAFNENTGPLTDQNSPLAERQALAHLFAGAIGSYKNPHSHRNVVIGAEDAVEMIMLASHLIKIVNTRHGAMVARTLAQTGTR